MDLNATLPDAPVMTYGDYLRLPDILDAQTCRSAAHDEMLFIIIHQASELWMKLCLHEFEAARAAIRAGNIPPALKMMARIGRVQEQLIQSWDVLATITPADYSKMRGALGTSSGFQSHQYRLIEFIMGAKNESFLAVHAATPAIAARLRDALSAPSLYDEAIALLGRRGLPVADAVLRRDVTRPYVAHSSVEAAWAQVYAAPERFWDIYELAEKLVDLEYRFQIWRFGHLKAIERVIGFKRGTGGSSGVPYLAAVIEQVFFPELLDVRKVL